ncbi:hypothetical protein [Dyadobacter sp. 32]|uniref:hypothetical protein n=1 Tax=Dyadobacter sp. 32 TaxID=538966 RepID=UPI0011EE5AD5
MSKPKTSIGDWLSRTFGSSYKTISEKLSAEEHDAFVKDAEKLQSDGDEGDESDDDGDESTDPDPKSSEKGKGADTIEARLTALETSYAASQKALKAEQKTNKTLNSKVTELEGKLKVSEEQKAKLRNSVNQLGDEDVTNSAGEEEYLTQADIDARASFNRSNPKK